MVGLPGSGKSTFAKALAKKTKAAVLESDKIRKALFAEPKYTGPESGTVFKTIMDAARQCGSMSHDCIVDATNLTTRDRRPFYDLAKASGFGKFVTIVVRSPDNVCIERLKNKVAGNNSEATEDVYWRMADKHGGDFPYGVLLIDGTIDTEESLKEVMEAVKVWPTLR